MHIVTIGTFDGVHTGHQALLRYAAQLGTLHVWVFIRRPRDRWSTPSPYLLSLRRRIAYLHAFGADRVHPLWFTPTLQEMEGEWFLAQIMQKSQGQALVLGAGAALGKGRACTQDRIANWCAERGVHFTPFPLQGGLSSTTIRQLLEKGAMEKAASALGRPFQLEGYIKRGAALGRVLGFPTLNLPLHRPLPVPFGVYAGYIEQGKRRVGAAINLGLAPTLHRQRAALCEVHLLEPATDCRAITVALTHFIRPEKKFKNKESLIKQINLDLIVIKKHLDIISQ